jgi:hypothetical protein
MDFIDRIAAEWLVISGAPFSFLAAIAVIAIVIFAFMNWWHGGTITTLEQRLKLKEDQLEDYKNKLDGRTPDEAKARLDALETRLSNIEPRRLNDTQINELSLAVSKIKGQIAIAHDMAAPESRHLAGALVRAFGNGGWKVETPQVAGISNAPSGGIALRVPDRANLSEAQDAVLGALKAIGLQVEVQQGAPKPHGFADTELLVTTRFV